MCESMNQKNSAISRFTIFNIWLFFVSVIKYKNKQNTPLYYTISVRISIKQYLEEGSEEEEEDISLTVTLLNSPHKI